MASGVTVTRRFDPNDTSKPKLWAAKICPFAEKTVLALNEMGISYDKIDIDLQNKPAEFLKVSPKGQVPVMEDQGHCIEGSYNILQYIDEMWARSDNKTYMPAKPYERAVARQWCEYINSSVAIFFFHALFKPTAEEREEAKLKILESLRKLNAAMKSISDGPFFMGVELNIVDIVLATHVHRFPVLKHLSAFEIPETEEYERFHSWWKAVEKVPSFQQSRAPESYIIETYRASLEQAKSRKK